MDMFETLVDRPRNRLSQDGTVYYYGPLMSQHDASAFLNLLLENIEWKNDEAIIYGKRIITKRKVAWYGEKPFQYTYSKVTKQALPWTHELLELKQLVQQKTAETYNSCLLNLYHNGAEGMAWHSDAETALKKHAAIASLSLGAERKFSFKHKKSKQTVSLILQHGSLLVMKGLTQTYWQHRLPPSKKINQPRVNLTFRTIVTT